MGKWFLWNRKTHTKVVEGFDTKAEAQRFKISQTKGKRSDPFIAVYRTNVVPATDDLLAMDQHRGYFWL